MYGLSGAFWQNSSAGNLSIKEGSESTHPFSIKLIANLCLPSYVDQLNQILHYLGTPSEDTLRRVGSPRVSALSK